MRRRPIVGVDDVASRAAAAAIIAGLIVRARERQQRVEKTSLLKSKKHRIGAEQRAESALAELDFRPARIVLAGRIADLALLAPAPLEDAQHVAGLRDLPALERIAKRQDARPCRLLRRPR